MQRSSLCTGTEQGLLPSQILDLWDPYVPQSLLWEQPAVATPPRIDRVGQAYEQVQLRLRQPMACYSLFM